MNRRKMLHLSTAAVAQGALLPSVLRAAPEEVRQYDCFELAVERGSQAKKTSAIFRCSDKQVVVDGFDDGVGVCKIRFMPMQRGTWTYEVAGGKSHRSGQFTCVAPAVGVHGPVAVTRRYHLAYADGNPYFPFGTTVYSMGFIGQPYEDEVDQTLARTAFNKVRLCVMPKYVSSKNPRTAAPLFAHPFQLDNMGKPDFSRINPVYFQHLDRRIQALMHMGIEADLILFHPYDGWGYSTMSAEEDAAYVRYVVARYGAYRNVWWSIANEYDAIHAKSLADWDALFQIVRDADPYGHLRSIHHYKVIYDHREPWVTHASLQSYDFQMADQWRDAWGKPVLYDEMEYEGDVPMYWGNLSAQEMTRRFWMAVVHGCYASHGEVYQPKRPGQLYWTEAGTLAGTSAPRIAFLRKLVEDSTQVGLEPIAGDYLCVGTVGQLYLIYLDYHQPANFEFTLPEDLRFNADVIDTWEMTIGRMEGTFTGKVSLPLARKTGLAVRLVRV